MKLKFELELTAQEALTLYELLGEFKDETTMVLTKSNRALVAIDVRSQFARWVELQCVDS